jgi:hypothetical protein
MKGEKERWSATRLSPTLYKERKFVTFGSHCNKVLIGIAIGYKMLRLLVTPLINS